ncbi:hypothetical protein [Mesomycoplasma hyopneumoniae]|uniref:hypothetical protein n=1 Tax=Mesomycoplasma hyopneumoniae TaxID=2099 RepID=UPI003267532D
MAAKTRKKPSIGLIIFLVITLSIVGYIIYQYLQPQLKVVNLSFFERRLIENAQSATDKNFFMLLFSILMTTELRLLIPLMAN